MSAYEIAVTAAMRQQQEVAAKRAREDDTQRKQREAIYTYCRQLLADSPLRSWFPDVRWATVDTPQPEGGQNRFVVRPEVGDESEQFQLLLTRDDSGLGGEHLHVIDPDNTEGRPVNVFWATQSRDTDTGYLYWTANHVTSVEEIGRMLMRRGVGN